LQIELQKSASYWEGSRQYRTGQKETVLEGAERTVSRCGCGTGTVREPTKGNDRLGKPVPEDWRDSRRRGLIACRSGLLTVAVT
jgi:hypothetical protein